MWIPFCDGGRRVLCRAAMLLCAVTLLGGAPRATAAPEPVLSAEVGHGGAVRRNFYFPIRIKIGWVAKPGEPVSGEAQAARLEVRVPQDTLYSAAITRDVTIQPGQRTSVVVYARSQIDFDAFDVELRDGRGRLLVRSRFNSMATGGWWPIDGDQAIVLAVGKSSLPRSGWVFDHQNMSPVKVEEVLPKDLPRQWPGYDGVTLVVLGDFQSDHLDAFQIRALLEWVRQGGQLVVAAMNQMDTFNEVLGDQNWPLTFGEYNSNEFDVGLVNVLRGALKWGLDPDSKALNWGRQVMSVKPDSPMGWFNEFLPEVIKECEAFSGRYLYSRSIEMSSEAMEAGWSVRRAVEAFNPAARREWTGGEATGDIVAGPVGLGSLTILGIDPASLAGGNARELRGVGWWHCLEHIEPLRAALSYQPAQVNAYYGGYGSSLDSMLASSAVNDVLDELSIDFGVNHGLFGAIAVALLLLVLLIGPVDYVVLRWTRREPLTWITCPVLVLLACGAIYFAQESVSYGTARASRLTIVDAWSGATRGAATSFTAIASARGGGYSLDGLGDGIHMSPTCWNPPPWYYYGNEPPSTSILIDQTSTGSHVRSLSVPLANVRWLEDRGPIELPAITGVVRFDLSHDTVWVDVVAPPDVKCRVMAVQWNNGWYVAGSQGVALSDGRLTDQLFDRAADEEQAAKWRRSQATSQDYFSVSDFSKGWPHDLDFQIPGHRQIGRRLASMGTEDAAILISIDERSGVELTRDGSPLEAEWKERMHLRLLVPAHRAPLSGEGNRP